ncbi:MAG: hypothetical protein GC164_03545 [Phycisphaera sp.]|nr:hypothetical protein [Phycisphaera sp.]
MTQAPDNPFEAMTTEEVPHHKKAKKDMEPAKMGLNFTSMIDVIFQLLIYFVLTSNFAVGEGVITAELPRGGAAAASTEMPDLKLNIVLSHLNVYDCIITIEGSSDRIANFTALKQTLEDLQFDPSHGRHSGAYKPDDPVIIKPDGETRWQHVVNAFNASIAARYKNISFAQARSE